MSKAQEKEILRAGINLMVSQAGPHSYLAGIFTPETIAAVEKDIDDDIIFDFASLRKGLAYWQEEINRAEKEAKAGREDLDKKTREFRMLSEKLNSIKAEIRELVSRIR